MHTGTGRFSRMAMRTMSLFESGESTGEISLKDLFDGKKDMFAESKMTIERIAFILTRGGWPEAVGEENEKYALKMVYNYLDAVAYLLDSMSCACAAAANIDEPTLTKKLPSEFC